MKTVYQSRMSKFVWAGTAYTLGAIWFIREYELGSLGWLVFMSTAFLAFALAAAADAVFDSLIEKINERNTQQL